MKTSSDAAEGRRRLDSLTSLRFPAALFVFGFHTYGIWTGVWEEVGEVFFRAGRSGVAFFFVLSGVVLAWSWRAADTPVAFYRRRWPGSSLPTW